MITTSRFSLVAAGVALACGLGSTAARADAVAQAIINVTNFQITLSNPGALGVVAFSNTVDAKGDLNNVQAVSGSIVDGKSFALGDVGSYVAGAVLSQGSPASGTYSAGTSTLNGDVLGAGANSSTDAVVSLDPSGDGTSQGNTGVVADFSFKLSESSNITFAFDAFTYLRAMLAAPLPGQVVTGTGVQATTTYSITITDENDATIFSWTPDGSLAGGISGGTESKDDRSLNVNRGATAQAVGLFGTRDLIYGPGSGSFEATTNLIGAGIYNLAIRQTTLADANVTYIPEPASLALVGVALFGAGVVARRRKNQA